MTPRRRIRHVTSFIGGLVTYRSTYFTGVGSSLSLEAVEHQPCLSEVYELQRS